MRAAALLIGLCCYGVSMAMMVRAELGLDPWDVFHQGLSRHTPMSIGAASAVVGVAVLLAWIPLRNKPGVGTLANVVVIAVTVDAGLARHEITRRDVRTRCEDHETAQRRVRTRCEDHEAADRRFRTRCDRGREPKNRALIRCERDRNAHRALLSGCEGDRNRIRRVRT